MILQYSHHTLFVLILVVFHVVDNAWCFARLFNFDRPTANFTKPKFLLILLDGFGANYFNISRLHAFDHIKKNGVHAEYMVPQFPSLSYPNYFSILTGRYVENHHIALNFLYNPGSGEKFSILDSTSRCWWDMVEPMWVSTTNAGLRTRVYLWPGCELSVKGVVPDYCLKYSLKIWTDTFGDHLRDIVRRFANDDADVGFVYSEQPDLFGHVFGPWSPIVRYTVRSLNGAVQRLIDDLDARKMLDKVNLIIVSDHGMTYVGPSSAEKIALSRYLNEDDVEIVLDHGPVTGIHPVPGKLETVYKSLKEMPGMHVWKKDEIPENLRLKRALTVPPILIVAKKGYFLKGLPDSKKQIPTIPIVGLGLIDLILQGHHGYDPSQVADMNGIFLAMGPAFKKDFTLGPIFNKDVYNLAMRAVGLTPLPNDGNWTSVVGAFRTPSGAL